MKPSKPFIQRGALVAWLTGEGFAASHVRSMIGAGAIPKKSFPGRARVYYDVAAVAAALGIANPLAQNSP
jgi:hypothetical protein